MKAVVRLGFAVGAVAMLAALGGCEASLGGAREDAPRDTMVQLPDGTAVEAASVAGWEVLQWAAQDGDLPLVQGLVAGGVDYDMPNELGGTALTTAVFCSQEEVVGFLLKCGADANRRDANGIPPLHDAALNGAAGIARLLIRHGARVDAADILRRTALHYAAAEGRIEVAGVLLASGADAEAMDLNGQTPLDVAETSSSLGVDAVAELLRDSQQSRSQD